MYTALMHDVKTKGMTIVSFADVSYELRDTHLSQSQQGSLKD